MEVQRYELAWELLFQKQVRLPEDDFGNYDYNQFVVARAAVVRRSFAFFEHAWKAFTRRQNYELLPGTRFLSKRVEFNGGRAYIIQG